MAEPNPFADTVLCERCAVEYDADSLPTVCPICDDEREYLPQDGRQHWVTVGQLADRGARIRFEEREPGLWGLTVENGVGIGQEAKVVVTPAGNVMVDVPAYIDEQALERVSALGGLTAIIASHPHMYAVQSAWSQALGGVPVYVSAADEHWLGKRPAAVRVWSGEAKLPGGIHASQPGGHFPGSVVVHYVAQDGRGVLLAGDTIFPVPDTGWVTFMRSYPNLIPLSPAVVRRIADHVERYDFDRLYGNFHEAVTSDAKAAVRRSAERYAAWAGGEHDELT